MGRQSLYRLARPELLAVLRAAEQLLEATGNAVALCPVYGAASRRAANMARLLSWVSLGWMTAEGVLGLIAGLGAGSISLIGWALGSAIEGLASVVVIWRFTGSRTLSAPAETTAIREAREGSQASGRPGRHLTPSRSEC